MPKVKKADRGARPDEGKAEEFRYRPSDSESVSVTVLTSGVGADRRQSVLVNGAALV
jgi:hypothetical protein